LGMEKKPLCPIFLGSNPAACGMCANRELCW
jgi:hypothetical protein